MKHVIIVAGGSGLRMGTDIPKQFLPIGGKPMLMRTIEAFHGYSADIHIVLVLADDFKPYWKKLCAEYNFHIPHELASGGETRYQSVKNGLALVHDGMVAVHDGARPFVSHRIIADCFSLVQIHSAVVPTIPVTDSIRVISESDGNRSIDRSTLHLVQTPQVFDTELLKQAYEQPFSPSFTDDASVVECIASIALVQGDTRNIKVTNPIDLEIAEWILRNPEIA